MFLRSLFAGRRVVSTVRRSMSSVSTGLFRVQRPSEAGAAVREQCRRGELNGPTAGLAMGIAQANLVVLPKAYAYDFLLFCQRNPKPCPLLEVTDEGSAWPQLVCHPDSQVDLRTDLPKYCVYRDGVLHEELTDITSLWQPDFVAFLLGCSFSFEEALMQAGLPVRHLALSKNVPMYRTNVDCHPAGRFAGPLVVSMRPFASREMAEQARIITARYPGVHGEPVHVGDPTELGIEDLSAPDFGDAVTVAEGEIPAFWACGVTPQAVAMHSRPPLMITHAPGSMLVCDVHNDDLAVGGVCVV